VAAGTAPFVLFGLAALLSKVSATQGQYEYPVFYLFITVGLVAGWVRGFPRWSLSYLIWGLIMAWWWSGMSAGTLGARLGLSQQAQWGWIAWAPLGLAALLGLLLSRSLRPVRALAARLSRDWSWISLGAYTFLCWVVLIFDSNHHPYLLALIVGATVASGTGAVLYLRSAAGVQRGLGLLAGLAGIVLVSVYSELTWDFWAYYDLPGTPDTPQQIMLRWSLVTLISAVLLLAPLLLGRRVPRRA
jgi:hypothetical protein